MLNLKRSIKFRGQEMILEISKILSFLKGKLSSVVDGRTRCE